MTNSTNDIWDIQADINGRKDFAFFVTNNEKYGIYFSNIDEYGMMKFVSPIQIWTNKQKPELLFKSNKVLFEYQESESCYYLAKSDIVILLTPCFHDKHYDLLYILFDFGKNRFTIINAPNFRLTELELEKKLQLEIHFRYSYDKQTKEQISKDNGKQIDLTKLKWHDIKHIDNICSLATK